MYHIADTYEALGRHHDHRVMREKTVGVFRRVLPENHPLTATACYTIGASYAKADDLQRAMEFATEALRMFQATSHPNVEDARYLVSHISKLFRAAK
jgi:hypothetical protein